MMQKTSGRAFSNMLSKAEFSFYLSTAGHVGHVCYPSFPDTAHGIPVDSALPAQRIGGIGYLPFA
jgi:hypothetical protein